VVPCLRDLHPKLYTSKARSRDETVTLVYATAAFSFPGADEDEEE